MTDNGTLGYASTVFTLAFAKLTGSEMTCYIRRLPTIKAEYQIVYSYCALDEDKVIDHRGVQCRKAALSGVDISRTITLASTLARHIKEFFKPEDLKQLDKDVEEAVGVIKLRYPELVTSDRK